MNESECILEVVIATYEEFLIGYKLKQENDKYTFEQSFTNHAHTGSVRSISCSQKYLASGSTDESIRIFCLMKRVDVGTVVEQQGTINCLQFFEQSHLFSCSEDSTICVWDVHNWECLKTLRGHKAGVNYISVHPSGKLLLSVSKDKTLRTWNLIKGRCAYITNLKAIASAVVWSPSGTLFAVLFDKRVDIYDISVGDVIHSMPFEQKANCVCFLTKNMVAIGAENGKIELHNVETKSVIATLEAHSSRVKDLFVVPSLNSWLFSLSSDGVLKLWEFDHSNLNKKAKLVASVNSTCRANRLTVWVPNGDSHSSVEEEKPIKRKKIK
ncbi:p21-activated protein kinase-interacting protein 1-like protein [Dinothrombium tinctorium]|uniref:p21-activated protein kinase-interacting protein 1-like protein n=1 Tax=Dinothrombium tinctorium TaxID=1965070 RepID=A0A3S3P3F1_9ACAR|nr:p21-activated protein kinase-interacting protein 1-like protein [Dinothrombium tinctorium]RWS04294.1 p21-activated protein kinase-interacting protein 1-like protein [Dinothrombium tinctorium]